MPTLTNKLFFILVLTVFVGCSTLQNWKNNLKPYKKSSPSKVKAEKPTKLDWDTSPLFKEGTKTFSIDEENILSNGNGTSKPCVDAKTGKEREFLLADLKSEVLSISYSDIQHVVDSLTIMGLKTLLAEVPTAVPFTVDARGRKTFTPKVGEVKKVSAKYTCADLPIFYQPKVQPLANLTDVIKNQTPPAYGQTGSQFSFVAMTPQDYGLNQSLMTLLIKSVPIATALEK